MNAKQKECILKLLKAAYNKKDFSKKYLLAYNDYFDIKDNFTDFACERAAEKQKYLNFIERLLIADKNTKIFTEVYGFEEDGDDIWIYADTLIIISTLKLQEIKHIFNKSDDYFPSDIKKLNDFEEYSDFKNYFWLDEKGKLTCISDFIANISVYCCWWD
jgi:hypothetical protein